MKFKVLGLAGVVVAAFAIPAFAHHSFAMFDAGKKVTLEGTIKEFQWTNPHSWIEIMVRNDQGQADQWSIEMSSPSALAKLGWLPKTLTPGMKVTATIHPLKDGTHGGQYMAVLLPDGKLMGDVNSTPVYGGAGPPGATPGNTR
jgi:hypothetical protein